MRIVKSKMDGSLKRRGMILLELVMAMTLAVFVLSTMTVFMKISREAWYGSARHSDLLQHARVAMSRIVNDLRYASQWNGYSDVLNSWGFSTANLTEGGTAVTAVQYQLNSGKLLRKTNVNSWRVVAGSQTSSRIQVVEFNPGVYAVDGSNNLYAPMFPADAKYIVVTLKLRDETGKQFVLRSGVDLRNKL